MRELDEERDGRAVVVRRVETSETLAPWLCRQLQLRAAVAVEGVGETLSVAHEGGRVEIVRPRLPGRSFADARDERGAPAEAKAASVAAVDVAGAVASFIQLADILERLHAEGLVHGELCPRAVWVHEHGGVSLVDSGCSGLLDGEPRELEHPELLREHLAYRAPEQIGRRFRPREPRSDLYALGVMAYERFSGRLPFSGASAGELLRAHLQLEPRPLGELCPLLPRALTRLVMKLLAKLPEHRPRSAGEVAATLRKVAAQLEGGGSLDAAESEPTLALPPRGLLMPHALFGRDEYIGALESELTVALDRRETRLVTLRGPAGVGKTSLLAAFERRVIARWGFLGIGRFEARSYLRPYAGLADALSELVISVAMLREQRREEWRERLRTRLGPLVRELAELVPALGEFLELPEVTAAPAMPEGPEGPESGDTLYEEPAHAAHRLALAVTRLLACFGERGPLVLMLEQLENADRGTVELLAELIERGVGTSMLVVVSVGPGRAVAHLEGKVPERRRREIGLTGFERGQLQAMVSGALEREGEALGELLEFIERHGVSDPLSVGEALGLLAERGALRWEEGAWRWTSASLAGADLPVGLEAITRCFIARASTAEREVLELASCLGFRFCLDQLTAISEHPVAELVELVDGLERKGVLLAMPRGYRFANGRLHTVTFARVGAERGRSVRRALGEHLFARVLAGARADGAGEAMAGALRRAPAHQLFSLASVLAEGNLEGGVDLDAFDQDWRQRLGTVHAIAGRRAMALANWGCALEHTELARALLEPELAAAQAGQGRHALLFSLYLDHAELLGLRAQIERAAAEFEALTRWQLEPVEFASAVARFIDFLDTIERTKDAVKIGVDALHRLEVEVPMTGSRARMIWWVTRAWRATQRHGIDRLAELPRASRSPEVGAMIVLASLKRVVYGSDLELFVLLSAVHVFLGMRAGLHPTMPIALAQLGVAISAGAGDPAEAGELCDRAIELAVSAGVPAITAQARAIAVLLVWPACRPWRWCAQRIVPAKRALEESGDMRTAVFAAATGSMALFEAGLPLAELASVSASWASQAAEYGGGESVEITRTVTGLAEALIGGIDDAPAASHVLSGSFSIEAFTRDSTKLGVYSITALRSIGMWLLGRRDEAVSLCEAIADDYEEVMYGAWETPRTATIVAVCAGHRCATADASERRALRKRMRRCEAAVRRWSQGARENFEAMAVLIAAERELAAGRKEQALARYEEAGELAHEFELAYVELLARERLVSLADSLRRGATTQGALVLALHTATQWGAEAVATRLRRVYGARLMAFGPARPVTKSGPMSIATSSMTSVEANAIALAGFDLDLMLATSQIIAQALRFEDIVDSLLSVALSSTGAERAVMLAERNGQLCFVAESRVRTRSQVFDEPVPVDEARGRLPTSAAEEVFRSYEPLFIEDLHHDPRFASDPYVLESGVSMLMAVPMFQHSDIHGVLMVEARERDESFDESGLDILRVFAGQAASAADNARLYEALQRSEANWRTLVDGVPDMISLLDRAGRVEFINHLEPYGTDPQSLIGVDSRQLMQTTEGPTWSEVLAEVVATGERREIEISFGAGATKRHYNVRLAPIEGADGGVDKLISIATDITERKQAASQREELETQLRQQQRLESLGTLASGVAHEINNPVQGIMNYSELIAGNTQDEELVLEFASEITLESQRVATIVRDLLAFSRQEREQLQLEAGHVSALIESTLSLIRTVLRKDHIRLEVDIPEGLPKVRCRVQQIQQVLMNLVTNARDALNDRYESFSDFKQIEIRARSFERHAQSWLRISVQDRGKGIPDDVQARIFDPFFTTKGRDQGTGLGLAVSHGIALEHGGELSFETELGIGTVFHLDLPTVVD
ncbi:probable serine/threonine kinase protein with two-component sensor domain [Plesiocystis pacifica SIR-1]|uniref:histidine kinase n=1 Tax=Plesiocystis pacifica SIR-1 TaxID=391625 RepID=A6G6B7_9BACT|nr:ATP-binding protein [Plesiocystis pacifica]EDM78546.1 probable serine/threonine kinase protein with two-component sensor domain [Plesiocystis pacifica SIR-1]